MGMPLSHSSSSHTSSILIAEGRGWAENALAARAEAAQDVRRGAQASARTAPRPCSSVWRWGAGNRMEERVRACGGGMGCQPPRVWRSHHPGAIGFFSGGDVDKQGVRRPPDPLVHELGRYTVVGGLASLVDVGLLVGLTHWGALYYLQAATIALGCGLILSYVLSIAWVFHERRLHSPLCELGLFTLIGGIGLIGNGVCMWILTEYAHLHYLYSKMGAALCVFLWNFLAKKYVLFHR